MTVAAFRKIVGGDRGTRNVRNTVGQKTEEHAPERLWEVGLHVHDHPLHST